MTPASQAFPCQIAQLQPTHFGVRSHHHKIAEPSDKLQRSLAKQQSSAGLWQTQMAAAPAPSGPSLEPFAMPERLKTSSITVRSPYM